jgi:hypothetical protein
MIVTIMIRYLPLLLLGLGLYAVIGAAFSYPGVDTLFGAIMAVLLLLVVAAAWLSGGLPGPEDDGPAPFEEEPEDPFD